MLMLRAPLSPPEITTELRSRFAAMDEAEALKQPESITAVVTKGDIGLPSDLMAKLPALRMIAVYGVGVDRIDLDQACARHIAVSTTPGVLTEAVAEHAIALIFAARRRVVEGDRHVRSGKWSEGKLGLSPGVAGSTLGILGYGRIGQRIGEMARSLGMKVIYSDRSPVGGQEATFRASPVILAKEADIMVIAAAGGSGTEKLVETDVLDALGPSGLLVNVARGSIVNEDDLVAALEENRLGSAALDVFDHEPTPRADLVALPNVVLTPHISSATTSARRAMGRMVIDNITAFFDHMPLPSALEF